MSTKPEPFLTRKFDTALLFARALHHSQFRKDTNIPYIAHLMSVCALVLEAGGNEDLAIAALLHDAVEDQGGEATRCTIEQLFGKAVANIVSECSDTDIEPKPPWRERKERYLKRLETASPEAILVCLADKLHNARAILADYRNKGDRVWKRFKAPQEDQLWYYGALLGAFRKRTDNDFVDELGRVLDELNRLCRDGVTAEL